MVAQNSANAHFETVFINKSIEKRVQQSHNCDKYKVKSIQNKQFVDKKYIL